MSSRAKGRAGQRPARKAFLPGEGGKAHLTSLEGLAALSLDALSSVAYGPEAIVLVLIAAGTGALAPPCRSPWSSPRCWRCWSSPTAR